MSHTRIGGFKTTADKLKRNKKGLPIPSIRLPLETAEEKEIASLAYQEFRTWRDMRNQTMSLFGNLTLTEYIDESKYRYITSVYERDNIEDWQGVMHVPMTRNKINNISGRAIQSMPIGQIKGHGTGKHRRSSILNDLYEYSEETNSYAMTMADVITEALVCGTAVIYEGHIKETKLKRDIKSDGTVSKEEVVKNKLITTIVNLEDFYPSNVFVSSIHDLSGAAWREVLDHSSFLKKYSSFEKGKEIPAYAHISKEDFPAYRDDTNLSLGEGMVEVLHIYKENTDEYIILANGIWINPIEISEDKFETSPLPFKHKKLPFAIMKFEHLSSNFLYGKSMPDKLRESQDQLDVMSNMVYDQSIMALFSPIITSSSDYIEDDILRPGRRISIDTGGKSINDSIKELKISPPNGFYSYVLDYTKGIINDASVDSLGSGSTSELADRTTAAAIETAAAGIASTLSYFGLQIQEFVKRKTTLRIGNILQVYFDPKNPIAHKIIGEKMEYINSAFNEFSIENAALSPDKDGRIRRGRKIIQVYKDESEMPSAKEVEETAAVESVLSGERVEIVALPFDYIEDMFDFDVKVVADKRIESTKAAEQAVVMYKAQTYSQLFPGMINMDELAVTVMEANGDDPTKLLLSLEEQDKQKQDMQMADMQTQGGVPGGVANNMGNNAVQQMAGAAQRI